MKNTPAIVKTKKKVLVHKAKLDDRLKKIIKSNNLNYDVFESYQNRNLDKYFLVVDNNYNKKLYLGTIRNGMYYSCNKPKNNHIIRNVSSDLLRKLVFRIKFLQKHNVDSLINIIKNRRVLICSIWDYGFSAYNLFTAIKALNTDVDYFTFNVDYRNKVLNRKRKVQNSIRLVDIDVDNYDVLIYKDDYNLSDLGGVKVLDARYDLLDTFRRDSRIVKINIVGGSFYRNDLCLKSHCPKTIALNTIGMDNKILDYDFVFGLTHDLCYYFDTFFFGHKQIRKEYLYTVNNDLTVISHSPSDRNKKGTKLIEAAVNNLKRKFNIEFVLIENVSQEESIEIKKRSHLFIDQLYAEGYGNSLVEAIGFGVPSMANVTVRPVLNVNPTNVQKQIESFITLSNKEKMNMSVDTYNYYLKHHTFLPYRLLKHTNEETMSGLPKVLILTLFDCANLGNDYALIMKRQKWPIHYAKINLETDKMKYGSLAHNICENKKLFYDTIKEVDIVHLFGDEPLKEYYKYDKSLEPLLKGKIIICTAVGSNFRRTRRKTLPFISESTNKLAIHNSTRLFYGKWDLSDYDSTVLTVCTPELVPYNNNDICFIPSIFPRKSSNSYLDKGIHKRKKIIITHSPSNYNKKGTVFIREAIKLLSKEYYIKYIELHGMTNDEVLRHKANSTIFIDQCFAGWYGKSLIEAIQYGVPSLCYISPHGKNMYLDHFKDVDFPIVEILPNSVDIYSKIKDIIDHGRLARISDKSFEYFNKLHYEKCYNRTSQLYKLCYTSKDRNVILRELDLLKTYTNESIVNQNSRLDSKKISILTLQNYGGSAGNFSLALTEKGNNNVKCIDFRKGGHPYDFNNSTCFYNEIGANTSFVESSDIIHLKGDFPAKKYKCIHETLKRTNKEIHITFDSSICRENLKNFPLLLTHKDIGLWNKKKTNSYIDSYVEYLKANLFFKYNSTKEHIFNEIKSESHLYKKSIITACLLPSLDQINNYSFIPHCFKSSYSEPNNNSEIVITHSPSNNLSKKGTVFIEHAIRLLQEKYNIKYIRLHNMSNAKVLSYKKKSTLFIDQCIIGWYGNSLVEAISYGIPSCAYISSYSMEVFKRNYPTVENPIINILPNCTDIYNKIESFLINKNCNDIRMKTIAYFNKVHSFDSSKKLLTNFYKDKAQ